MTDVSYQCGNCNYRFTPKNPDKVPENCPYCNKPETLDKVKSAQDYLDDVTTMTEERENRE